MTSRGLALHDLQMPEQIQRKLHNDTCHEKGKEGQRMTSGRRAGPRVEYVFQQRLCNTVTTGSIILRAEYYQLLMVCRRARADQTKVMQ
jgi:hypothetical protein